MGEDRLVRGYAGDRAGTRIVVLRGPGESLVDLRERAWNLVGGDRLYTLYAQSGRIAEAA